jgi:hypothetical protein
LLVADTIGRILVVLNRTLSIGAGYQNFGIITGTSIVIFFAIYIGAKLKVFL